MLGKNQFKNFDVESGVKFPILTNRAILMTRKDLLRVRSNEIKPKILEYLEKNKTAETLNLMKRIDANIFEMKFAIEELKKEGRISTKK